MHVRRLPSSSRPSTVRRPPCRCSRSLSRDASSILHDGRTDAIRRHGLDTPACRQTRVSRHQLQTNFTRLRTSPGGKAYGSAAALAFPGWRPAAIRDASPLVSPGQTDANYPASAIRLRIVCLAATVTRDVERTDLPSFRPASTSSRLSLDSRLIGSRSGVLPSLTPPAPAAYHALVTRTAGVSVGLPAEYTSRRRRGTHAGRCRAPSVGKYDQAAAPVFG